MKWIEEPAAHPAGESRSPYIFIGVSLEFSDILGNGISWIEYLATN